MKVLAALLSLSRLPAVEPTAAKLFTPLKSGFSIHLCIITLSLSAQLQATPYALLQASCFHRQVQGYFGIETRSLSATLPR